MLDREGAYADSSAVSWRAVAWLAWARAAAVVAGRGGMVAIVLVSEHEARSGGGGCLAWSGGCDFVARENRSGVLGRRLLVHGER